MIKPEWVPLAYLDKKSKEPVIKTVTVEYTLYHRHQAVVSKSGFKRKQVK